MSSLSGGEIQQRVLQRVPGRCRKLDFKLLPQVLRPGHQWWRQPCSAEDACEAGDMMMMMMMMMMMRAHLFAFLMYFHF